MEMHLSKYYNMFRDRTDVTDSDYSAGRAPIPTSAKSYITLILPHLMTAPILLLFDVSGNKQVEHIKVYCHASCVRIVTFNRIRSGEAMMIMNGCSFLSEGVFN